MSSKDADRLRGFVRGLPQADRYILLLSYADGLTSAEIALVLDLPVSRVESRLEVLRREAEATLRGATTGPSEPIPAPGAALA